MGVKEYTAAKPGELFDAMSEKVVTEVDPVGKAVEHRGIEKLVLEHDKLAKPSAEILLKPLVAKLWEILETQYGNDAATMAQDLGLPLEEMKEILEGKGWIDARWFLRRIATLLYRDREVLTDLYNEERGLGDQRVGDADIQILKSALTVYYSWEGFEEGEITIQEDLGYGEETIRVAPETLTSLDRGTLGEIQWRRLWQGLALYFGRQASQEAQNWFEKLKDHLFQREGWDKKQETAQERLLFQAREMVALKFGGLLPTKRKIEGVSGQGGHGSLTRWLAGKKKVFGKGVSPSAFYSQVKALLTGLGVSREKAEALIVDAVFEENGWDKKQETAQERLLFQAREMVALKFGGLLPTKRKIEGVSGQGGHGSLTRWLAGESVCLTSSLFSQIRALLLHENHITPAEADRLIAEVSNK